MVRLPPQSASTFVNLLRQWLSLLFSESILVFLENDDNSQLTDTKGSAPTENASVGFVTWFGYNLDDHRAQSMSDGVAQVCLPLGGRQHAKRSKLRQPSAVALYSLTRVPLLPHHRRWELLETLEVIVLDRVQHDTAEIVVDVFAP